MLNYSKRFLRETDAFGLPIMQNMHGATTLGTIVGGIITIVWSAFFFMFIAAQLYIWFVEPSYTQSSELSFLTQALTDEDKYTVPLHKLMPAFTIIDFSTEPLVNWVYNDRQVKIDMEEGTFDGKEIDVAPCSDVIERMSDLSEA